MNQIATRADIIRALTPGTVVTMTAHDWYPDGWLIGVPRIVTVVQSKRVALRTTSPDGDTVDSWMSIPDASSVRVDGPETFSVRLSPNDEWMTYRIGKAD